MDVQHFSVSVITNRVKTLYIRLAESELGNEGSSCDCSLFLLLGISSLSANYHSYFSFISCFSIIEPEQVKMATVSMTLLVPASVITSKLDLFLFLKSLAIS